MGLKSYCYINILLYNNSRKKERGGVKMKKLFEVVNVISSHSFGYIAAESENEALDLLSQDAGYEDYKEACDVTDSDELVAEEVDIEDLVKGWVDQLLEEDPEFRCATMRQLSEVIANSNAPAFPTLPEEFVDSAYDITWETLVDYWRGKILDEFGDQVLDHEELDPLGEGVELCILPDVLSGMPVSEAVRDWVDWKRQDIKEREEEGA
jgi:hypothetical protein